MEKANSFGVTKSHSIKVALLAMLAASVVAAFVVLADSANAQKTRLLTRTFTGPAVTINDAVLLASTAATPYPAQANVQFNGKQPKIRDLNVRLLNFTHPFPDDVDVLLAAPGGQCVIVMSDAGSTSQATNLNLTLDDAAAASLPDATPLGSGTFKPTNHFGADNFPPPAPDPATCGSTLATFNGLNPNGAWQLFVIDDFPDGTGSIGSFDLEITAESKKKKRR